MSAEAIARCREALGLPGTSDPLAAEWDGLTEHERRFWLRMSRQSEALALRPWRTYSGDVRCILRNNLYRAASRASVLLKAGAAS